MTLEEIQLAIAENQLAASRLMQASQVRASQNYEAQTLADRKRAETYSDNGVKDTGKLLQACQLRAAQNYEAQTLAEREKVEAERDTGVKVCKRADQQSANYMRPSFVFKPTLEKSADGWMAIYGHLEAWGETPEIAYQEFDHQWVGKDEL
jgi:hypothetical protein